MNNNYNNLYCDYIGASGTYSITDYIDNTSNILNTKIINTSNILDTKIINTSNILNTKINYVDYKYNNLIRSETENNLINTYIYNSNVGGEIRFYVKNSGIFDINNASGQPYRVKIGVDGRLYLYYNYNVAIGLIQPEGWVEPLNMLIGHNVAIGNLNIITGATDAAVSLLLIKVKKLEGLVYEANIIRNDEIFYNPNSTYDQLRLAYNTIKNNFTYANSMYAGIVGSLGFGATFIIYGWIQSQINADFIENNLQYHLLSNTNITEQQKELLKIDSFNVYQSNLNDMNINLCNLNIINGFINSNITTQQFINNINTNQITYNGCNIDNVFLSKQNGGFIYNNIGINAPTSGTPITGILGGNGDRIILQPAPNAIDYTCSTGIDLSSKNYWFSSSSNFNYNWYIGGSNLMTLNSNTLNLSNVIIDASNIRQAGKEITSISSNIVLTSTPNIIKKYAFNFNCSSSILIGATTYYKYDIDLTKYTITKINGTTPFRIFNIKIFIASAYFEVQNSGIPNILSYEIFMSNPVDAGTPVGNTGINISAIGVPLNYKLNQINPTYITLMRTANFNYLSVIATVNNTLCSCIIQDLLN